MSGRRLSVRDYKGARRDGLAHAWLRPFTLGLVLGLAIAAGLYIAANRHTAAAMAAGAGVASAPSERNAEHAVSGARSSPAITPAASAAGAAAGSSSVAGNAQSAPPALPTGLPKYDFYQMLPRSQVLIPQRESEARVPVGATVERPGVYFLQIGSYKDATTADRVRVGPIRDLALLNHMRHQLQAGNLAAMVVRVNP